MAWVVRHAAWLITRFVVRPSGRTAYEALRGRAYRSELVEIGERVFAKKPGDSQNVTKLDRRWEAGIWVGKTETSEEHLVRRPRPGSSACASSAAARFPTGGASQTWRRFEEPRWT